MRNTTLSVRTLKLAAFVLLLVAAGVLVASCSGSKANVRTEETRQRDWNRCAR